MTPSKVEFAPQYPVPGLQDNISYKIGSDFNRRKDFLQRIPDRVTLKSGSHDANFPVIILFLVKRHMVMCGARRRSPMILDQLKKSPKRTIHIDDDSYRQ
jgi:hypothetical protein